jgi:hypothetical protein
MVSNSSTGRDPMAGEQAAAQVAPEQQGDASWPKPGEEGYVTPDGTPQASRQLEENRQAAANRAAVGSIIHGAPAATNDLVEPGVAAGIAERRAEAYSGPTEDERKEGVKEFVEDARNEQAEAAQRRSTAAAEQSQTRESAKPAAEQKDGSTAQGKTTR